MRYRQYKNGIFGHRYNGLYIVKNKCNNTFSIIDQNKNNIESDIPDFDDCVWQIDKLTATKEDKIMIDILNSWELYKLSKLLMELQRKNWDIGLTQREQTLYKWVCKVRSRKDLDKEIW